MSVDYRWNPVSPLGGANWGTVKFPAEATAADGTYRPVILTSNTIGAPTQGAELLGVAVPDYAASETGVPVVVTEGIFEVQLAAGENPSFGDALTIEEDGSCSVWVEDSGDAVCGHVVEYDPASGGICKVKAQFDALRTLTGLLEVDTAQLAADCVTGAKIADDAVDSEHIADGAVDLAHMSANSVDSDQYVDGSIDLAHLSADCVDGTKIADDAIDSEHIADGAVDLAHMSANSVDSDQYVDGSIDNAHLADDAVDSDEIADGAIDLAHMSANSVDSDQYVDGSIDLVHMSAESVDSDQYVDGSVDPEHLAAECTEKVTLTFFKQGDITADPGDAIVGIGSGVGTITKAGFAMLERGIDDADALSLEMNAAINGTTVFTTAPKITEKAGGAATSFEAGDDIVVGVINAAANTVAEFDVITIDWTLVRTTPDTEANGICAYVEIEYKVGA